MPLKKPSQRLEGRRLLVVNTGSAKKRFTLKRLHELGCRLTVLHVAENWARDYVDHWVIADTNNHTAALRAIENFVEEHPQLRPEGVLTFWEDDVLLTALIRDRLGLIGIPYEVARVARDKHLFRAFCREHGLPAPGFGRTMPTS